MTMCGIGQRQVDEDPVSPPADYRRGHPVIDSTFQALLSVWGRAVVLVPVNSTVNVWAPVEVGFPEMLPAFFSFNPGDSAPDPLTKDHEWAGCHLLQRCPSSTGYPPCPSGRELVVTAKSNGTTTPETAGTA